MIVDRDQPESQRFGGDRAQSIARWLPPVPLFPLKPLLDYLVVAVAKRRPELFNRLGDNCQKRFLIDPNNLPFFLLLVPDPEKPQLKAFNRGHAVEYDVRISASFLTLLKMIDSQTDSDALFFNRDLSITGDTEAIVALRNALDDIDSTLASDIAAAFGPLSGAVRALFSLSGMQKGPRS